MPRPLRLIQQLLKLIDAGILLDYYMCLQLGLFMVLVSGYVECVKLHHIWKPQPHAVVYQLYTTLCSGISLTVRTYIPRHDALIFTSSVVHIYI